MSRLFISHLSAERELAEILKARLEKDFKPILSVFVSSDRTSIEAGSPWLEDLQKALAEAKFVIVLCSRASIGRPWVNFEAGAGWIRGIPLVPVCHSGLAPDDLPVPLSMLQSLRAGNAEDLKSLYRLIAKRLNVPLPSTDLDSLARKIQRFEAGYQRAAAGADRIHDPKILCAASGQYSAEEFGFDLDAALVTKCFPRATIVRDLTSKRLRNLLTTERFDIIHLVQAVDPNNGDLHFDPVSFPDYSSTVARPDKMSASGFADLVSESGARLIVLNTCQALFLAARVAPIANMVATHTQLPVQAAVTWAESFYELLVQGYSAHRAYDLTSATVESVNMALIRHKDFALDLPKVAPSPLTRKTKKR